jgi:putative hydrolase of the HAD superfamily
MGIITNGMTEVQKEKIRRVGIAPYFDTVLISQEVGIAKPDPRIFHMALERVRCEAHEAVMVGDSPDRDIAGARAVGLHALWVRTGRPRGALEGDDNATAHVILERLEELLLWLAQRMMT